MTDSQTEAKRVFNDDLFNIFTNYANTGGDKSDPETLDDSQFKSLLCDAGLTREDGMKVEEIQLIFSSCCSKASTKKMSYDVFVNSLLIVAMRVGEFKKEKKLGGKKLEDALIYLCEKRIFTADRRTDTDVSGVMVQEQLNTLLQMFEPALMDIFESYATRFDNRAKKAGVFTSGGSKRMIGHPELVQFALDVDLMNLHTLSRSDVATIYNATAPSPGSSRNTGLKFKHFWEALVRMALVTFAAYEHTSVDDKVCGLFLHIWRQVSKKEVVIGRVNIVVEAFAVFNAQFYSVWEKDNFRDYLVKPEVQVDDMAKTSLLMSTLLGDGKGLNFDR
jgi:hypothetical protein